jgi:aquaporin Z
MTAFFLLVILGATDRRAPKGFGPLAIGLSLTVIHLVSIPVTGTSVNPARSTGPALFVGGWALGQLWLFWVAPLAGAAIAGLAYPFVTGDSGAEPIAESGQDPTTTVISAGELGSGLLAAPDSAGTHPPGTGPQ